MKLQKKLIQIFNNRMVFVTIFMVVAVILLIGARAAQSNVSFEAEDANLVGLTICEDYVSFSTNPCEPHNHGEDCVPGIGSLGQHGPCIDQSLIPPPSPYGVSDERVISGVYTGGDPGSFRTVCDYSHMAYDDPVILPGQPGAAHLHTFFGNTGADAYSTTESLLTSGDSTCAGGTFNRSSYWIPSMIETSRGMPIEPIEDRNPYLSDLQVYYKIGYGQGVGYGDVQPFPNGLQLIAGNSPSATTDTGYNGITYWCDIDTQQQFFGWGSSIPVCPVGQYMNMAISFPQCWNGVDVTSPNGRTHMAYGVGDGLTRPEFTFGCPSTHPVGLPHIDITIKWKITVENTSATNDTSTWRLSSDNYTDGPGGYSGHADYVFAWEPTAFQAVVDNCYRPFVDCASSLGDGRIPDWPLCPAPFTCRQ